MFDLNIFLFLFVMLPFAYFSVLQDLLERKVSNRVTFPFLYVCFGVFVFNLLLYSYVDYLVLGIVFVVAFLLYKFDVWGGADGKIFIGIVLVLISLGDDVIFMSFLLNLLFFYVIGIVFIVMFRTKLKFKVEVLKGIDYGFLLFYLLLIFLVVKSFMRKFLVDFNPIFLLVFVLSIYFLIQKTNNYLKEFYYSKSEILRFFAVFALAVILALFSDLIVWFYFVLVCVIRILTQFFSEMTLFLKNSTGDKFYSPFTIYLFVSVIFSFFVQENIVSLFLNLFG